MGADPVAVGVDLVEEELRLGILLPVRTAAHPVQPGHPLDAAPPDPRRYKLACCCQLPPPQLCLCPFDRTIHLPGPSAKRTAG